MSDIRSDSHRRWFSLYLMEQDGRPLSPAERLELQAHLSTCTSCQADLKLYHGLRAQSMQRWPAAPPPLALERVARSAQRSARLRRVTVPLQALILAGFALLALVLAQWVFTHLRPSPAVLPLSSPAPASPTPVGPTPESTPTEVVEAGGKLPLEPLLRGEPSGSRSWSPEGDYFFIPLMAPPGPGGDRGTISLHFISAGAGEDCPASETFLGTPGSLDYAWLDNERVLIIDPASRALLFTRCQDGVLDLSDRFAEPLVRISVPLISPELAAPGRMLLESASAYWLFDPATLQARPLEDLAPSPDLADSFAWLPSGRQMSVLQPVAGTPERSRLVVLDLDSGQVLNSLEIVASSDGGSTPLVEWMGPERPFVWSFGTGGPLLVDLSADPPQQVRVLPELFGLDLAYPDQMSGMGAFYASENDSFHIVAHINLPEDQSIYLYHSETGQVEKLAGDRQVMMILPGDQRMPLVPALDGPTYDNGYDLVWVDRPEQPSTRMQVSGHTPRNYPNLQSRLLPGGERMLFGSTQGISLVDLSGGETLAFWRLEGAENITLPDLSLAPSGRALVVTVHLNESPAEGSPLYWLALDEWIGE